MYGEFSGFFRLKFLGCLAHREIWLQNVPLLHCYTLDVKFWPDIDDFLELETLLRTCDFVTEFE